MADVQRTATEPIAAALAAKGYYRGRTYSPQEHGSIVTGCTMFVQGSHLLVLQTYREGGCELYAPVCDTKSMADTIAAIPA